MQHDDGVRPNNGVVVSLRDMGNGASRLFFDDVRSNGSKSSRKWEHEIFVTFTPEQENEALENMSFSPELLQDIGLLVLARLVAIKKQTRGDNPA